MRSGFIGSRPLHLVPFHPFSLRTLLFSSFLSCPPVFMSWHFIPSFFCAHIGPALSVHARNLPSTQVSRPGLYNEVGFHHLSLCTWFPFHRNHIHLCPVLSSCHVFIQSQGSFWIVLEFGFGSVCSRGTTHVLRAMVQRSGHSTCGYHG